ncbi:MAG: AIR carboxylase family protein, partial [Clostridiales bacterium]|nr:AIR carboxylase family protein [Clostridiales bacterium]
KAAQLGGVLAAYTTLPVIGVPIKTSMMGGLDSLLSMVQMPSGIPVATVGVNAGANAGILAAQLLAVGNEALTARLAAFKEEMAASVAAKDEKVRAQFQD